MISTTTANGFIRPKKAILHAKNLLSQEENNPLIQRNVGYAIKMDTKPKTPYLMPLVVSHYKYTTQISNKRQTA